MKNAPRLRAMEKLVELWPKESGWEVQAEGPHVLMFSMDGGIDGAVVEDLVVGLDDRLNAPARDIIENALIELGYGFFSWWHEKEEVFVVTSTPTFSSFGKGASKTEALIDLAVKVLEARLR